MKKLFTLIVLACAFAANANATSKWYAFYTEVMPYPEYAGKVYAASEEVESVPEWSEDYEIQEVKEVGLSTTALSEYKLFFYGQPADGWRVGGVAKGVDQDGVFVPETDANGQVVIASNNNPLSIVVPNTTGYDNQTGAENAMNIFPDYGYFVVFTHVSAKNMIGESTLGKVSVSKVVNEIGDDITLTATPADERCSFGFWRRASDGAKITENPLNIHVDMAEEYIAHFDCDSAFYFNYPDGKYIGWYNEKRYTLPEGGIQWSYLDNSEMKVNEETGAVSSQRFFEDLTDDKQTCYFKGYEMTNAAYALTPDIVYLKGEGSMVSDGTEGQFHPANTLAQWTENGVEIASLPAGSTYYNTDYDNHCFTIVPAEQTSFAPQTLYLALPNDILVPDGNTTKNLEAIPQVIYWSVEDALAGPTGVEAAVIEKAVNDGQIYNLNGMKVTSLGRGIFIMNGKKILK